LEWHVEASLSSCSGLNSVQLVKWHLDGDGFLKGNGLTDLSATIGAEIKTGGISCQGTARAYAQPCIQGLKLNLPGSASTTVAVNRVVGIVSASVAPGTETNAGKLCLRVNKVHAELGQDDIQWKALNVNIGALPVNLPGSVIDKIWSLLPLDGIINNLKSTALGGLQAQLDKISPCF
jgi:hypothetical protein